ncbi:MAG: ATPase domain-containing protein [Thermoplasmata archaeon]
MISNEEQGQESQALCIVCGSGLRSDGQCSSCGALHETVDGKLQVKSDSSGGNPPPNVSPDQSAKEALVAWLKGEEGELNTWIDRGSSPAPQDATTTLEGSPSEQSSEPEADAPAAEATPSSQSAPVTVTHGPEALERWLRGDEKALDDWLAQSDPVPEETKEEPDPGEDEDQDIDELRAELVAMKRAVKAELAKVKGGRVDPLAYLEEIAKLNRKLQREVRQRKELESEFDHLKKSSVAVMKYVKTQKEEEGPEAKRRLAEEKEARRIQQIELEKANNLVERLKAEIGGKIAKLPKNARGLKEAEVQLVEREETVAAKEKELQAIEDDLRTGATRVSDAELERRLKAELAEKEREYLDRETEMKRQVIDLEGEVERLKIEAKLKAEVMELTGRDGKDVSAEFTEKARELQLKERDLILKEQEMGRLREEMAIQQDEVTKIKEPLAYKEEELLRREEDLIYREKLLEQEKKRVSTARNQAGSVEEAKLKERLETLKAEISRKEEEVRAKETYLNAKMEELRMREQGLIEEDIEAREEERDLEFKQEKVKTGTPRLDDLLLGGIPFGSNVSVYGPPFIGKEVLVNAFIAEGLKKGVPAIWVTTDKTPDDIRDEMQSVVPGYEEYENLGLVHYIDAYSKGMGAATDDAFATYIDDPTDQAAILEAVDQVAAEVMKEHKSYRLAFRTISTLMAYLDPASTFRFLQPFAGRRKRDKAVSLYVIEKGMHGEQDIQMLGSLMDGMVDFKVEQLKTYLSVKGISDAQSRAWIQYMYSKQGLSIGSFTLDHIR